MTYLLCILLTGLGATAFMDLWSLVRRQLFGVRPPDYALVGRWIAHLSGGKLRNDSLAAAPMVTGERIIGWTAHYLIGIGFACILPAIWGMAWLRDPVPGPALLVGIVTVAAPFFIMQPGMGAGIAASRTPRPTAARLHSVINHTVFGLGLYLAALPVSKLLAVA